MKTVYIDKKVIDSGILKESILLDSIPDDIMNAVLSNKTSLEDNPSIPKVFEHSFIERLINKRFAEIKEELQKIGDITDFSDIEIESMLAKLINKCQEEERPYRNALEKLCFNYVINLFEVPDDMIQLKLNLVDSVEFNSECIQLDPIKDSDDIEYESLSDISSIKEEVYKRRLLDVLCMGAGIQISSNVKSYISEIYDINPKLADLYRKILALNNYLLFTKEDFNISEANKMQMGTVVVNLCNNDEKVKINSQGKIFPVLLSETIRGFMELFASHGLPKNREKTLEVLGKADFLKAEPWDMRIGPSLWSLLSDSFDNVDSALVPYLFKKIAKLSPPTFSMFMSEIFAKTRMGKRLMAKVIEKAKEEKDYAGFEDKMSQMRLDKNLLSDEIQPEEL